MKVTRTAIEDVLILEPRVFGDRRGYFMETFSKNRYKEAGIDQTFVQDNLSYSIKNTLRGLHYQIMTPQAKLVQVITGAVFDVAVDIRPSSPSFGKWVGASLSEYNKRQLYIPEGFAHGFFVLSESAHFLYKCTAFYNPDDEGGILWNDPDIGIKWPVEGQNPLLSDKDIGFPRLSGCPQNRLPRAGGAR